MSTTDTHSADHPLPDQGNNAVFLDPFYTSPNTELCMVKFPNRRDPAVAKRLPIAYRSDPAQRGQFRSECAYLRALDHSGLAKPEAGLDIGNEIVQILVPGNYLTVRQLTEACRRLERPLPLELALFMIEQILHTLRYLHEKVSEDCHEGLDVVLHPDALLVDSAGQVLISTIGLSNPPYITSSILRTGNKRYFLYAAPEQCVGGRAPDKRACFYTLGMLCYELLTSQPLFSPSAVRDLDGVIRRKLRLLHPLASDVDPELAGFDEFITRLLDPIPEDRECDTLAIIATVDSLHPTDKRCGPNDLASFRAELETALQYGPTPRTGTDVAGQLSAVTDIVEYNAS